MEIQFLFIFTFLLIAIVASHAALPSAIYWNFRFPGTLMPSAVRDLIQSNVDNSPGEPQNVTNIGMGSRAPQNGPNVGTGSRGAIYHIFPRKRLPFVWVTVNPAPLFLYKYAATEDQLHDKSNVALFFLEKDLHQGKTMNLHFRKSANTATLLPRKVAESIPFSSKYMTEIYKIFSVKPNSKEAEIIEDCKEPSIKDEEKVCATSLESMIDFSISKLGKNVSAISTEVHKRTQMQKCSIEGVKKMASDKAVICHKQSYAYTVFYCHKTQTTEAYAISLVGADGTKAEAVAVCHKDTSVWNPKHLAFQVLKVKPGTIPVCHSFLRIILSGLLNKSLKNFLKSITFTCS